ncbi:phosphatase PAP2 family protein [Aestuariivirga sp.]|uniref:phosphatase PAP2 family protein n=1 Tax=Aestuariivirga sp. TaxID=2650926 RepID=UPI00391964BB
MLNHLVMSVPFPPADALLHGWDQAIGFDWNSYARWVASVEGLPLLLSFAYNEWMMIGLGAITFGACALNRPERVNELAFLMIVTGLASILVGAAFPAAAAWVMIATDEVKSTLGLYPQMEWYRQLGELRSGAPVFLDAARLEGLSTFPSFHTCLGLIILWCSRGHWLTLAAGALTSLAILAATPVFGGHYLVDMLAGGVVTALAVALWHWVRPWLRVADPNAACLGAFPPLFPRQFTFQRDGL